MNKYEKHKKVRMLQSFHKRVLYYTKKESKIWKKVNISNKTISLNRIYCNKNDKYYALRMVKI